jgi:hypothetical protein
MFKRLFNKNNMQKILFTLSLSLFFFSAHAEDRTIDISGDNTSTSYKSYSTAISLPAQDVVNVMMARYCYFSSKITGSGVLNLYGGGDRCFLGNADKKWPEWTGYTGDIHVHPFKENSSNAGFWGVVLAHGGKASSPENALDDVKGGKVNPSMANNRVTLHEGATMCGEANSNGSGFRIGELNTTTTRPPSVPIPMPTTCASRAYGSRPSAMTTSTPPSSMPIVLILMPCSISTTTVSNCRARPSRRPSSISPRV